MTYTDASAQELRRAVLLRGDDLRDLVGHLRGPLGPSRTFLRSALDLVDGFPDRLREVVKAEWEKNPQAASRCQLLTTLLRHTNFVADFVESHLAHGTRRELSEALVDELHRELRALNLSHYGAVISHGSAFNFTTTFGDLRRSLFGPLMPPGSPVGPPAPFALFSVPRIEGSGVLWRPLLIGHEVAHVAVHERKAVDIYDVWSKFDPALAATLPNPRAGEGSPPLAISKGLFRIACAWATELLCDAHAVHRYGPAGVAALGEYLTAIGGLDSTSPTHPPGLLRLRLLLDQLGAVTDPRLKAVTRPWDDVTPASIALVEPWANYLAQLFLANSAGLSTTVDGFNAGHYAHEERSGVADAVADRLHLGIAGCEVASLPDSTSVAPVDADVVNAVWIARTEDAAVPFDSLGKKTLESLEFVRRWIRHGGELPLDLYEPLAPGADLPENDAAVLSEDQLALRLRCSDDRRLAAVPLLHRPKGAGLDLRLGNRFIIFRRTGVSSFDPLASDDDPRLIQVHVELSWNERFVLHPQEVVLGATLEYLVFPADLTGQVVTRSSYGRLGLLTATAVQIHPGFHGCLTLELVNLSTIPISLTPGERIAQLVVSRTPPVMTEGDKYTYPIGPQFSKVRDDHEAAVLRGLRDE